MIKNNRNTRNEKAQINWAFVVCPRGEVNRLTNPVASDVSIMERFVICQ